MVDVLKNIYLPGIKPDECCRRGVRGGGGQQMLGRRDVALHRPAQGRHRQQGPRVRHLQGGAGRDVPVSTVSSIVTRYTRMSEDL